MYGDKDFCTSFYRNQLAGRGGRAPASVGAVRMFGDDAFACIETAIAYTYETAATTAATQQYGTWCTFAFFMKQTPLEATLVALG